MRKSLLLVCLALMFSTIAVAREVRLRLEYNDQQYRARRGELSTIYLKRDIRRKIEAEGLNINLNRASIDRITMLAKSRKGNASAWLQVGQDSSLEENVPGNPGDFRSTDRRTFHRVHLYNDSEFSRGKWQVKISGNVKVRGIVVLLDIRRPAGPVFRWQGLGSHNARIYKSPVNYDVNKLVSSVKIVGEKGKTKVYAVTLTFDDGSTVRLNSLEGHMKKQSKEQYLEYPRMVRKIKVETKSPSPFKMGRFRIEVLTATGGYDSF